MNPRNKFWLVLIVLVLAMMVMACSCGGLSRATRSAEPMSGLAGIWQNPTIGIIHVISWDGKNYSVSSASMSSGVNYPVSGTYWDGDSLHWDYYDQQYGQLVTIVVSSVNDSQAAAWYTTQGLYGDLIFYRYQP